MIENGLKEGAAESGSIFRAEIAVEGRSRGRHSQQKFGGAFFLKGSFVTVG